MLNTNGDSYEKYELLNDYEKGTLLFEMKDCELILIEEIARLMQALYTPMKGFKSHRVLDYVELKTTQDSFDRFTFDAVNDQVKNGYENNLKLSFNFGDNEEIALRYNYQSKRLQFLDTTNDLWCGVFRGKFFELGLYLIEKYDDYKDLFC